MTFTHGAAADDLPEEKIVPPPPTKLARIGAVYKVRARIRQDLLEHYAPKCEIVESLKTKDLAIARRRLPVIQKRYQDEWGNLRQSLFESKLMSPLPTTNKSPIANAKKRGLSPLESDRCSRSVKTFAVPAE